MGGRVWLAFSVPRVTMEDIMDTLIKTLRRSWWLFLTQGVLSVALGVLVLIWPGRALFTLILFLGLLMLLHGVAGILAAIGAAGNHEPWAWQLAKGIIGIVAGVAVLRWQVITALVIVFLVGAWALITGIMDIVEAIADHQEIPHAWLVLLMGFVSLLFGTALFARPAPVSLLVIADLVGIYAIVYGVVTCLIAFRTRSLYERLVEPSGTHGALPTAD